MGVRGKENIKVTGSFGRLEATESVRGVGSAGSMCRAVVEAVALDTDFLGLNSSSLSVPQSPYPQARNDESVLLRRVTCEGARPRSGPPALSSPWPVCVSAALSDCELLRSHQNVILIFLSSDMNIGE